ncbi:Glycosyltransferase [Xenorhabdus vietnamensis]|uniref:Glycosyltransferase n=1 Tax=Xenorhabdus vietnamensis TaxID=351656 RepID=A0A1Y2S649_9GAMM|nr:glycosyltransferase family 4 protein [Xenorhabdus vietnamensis]OTA14118.1 Glycosyltransferase [Xenorhabdus vietnamensis]
MKLLHLINLQGFGGSERLLIEYLKHSSFDNEILCTSNEINKNIVSELSHFRIFYANNVGSTVIKYPAILRKLALNKKIENSKADITIVWDFIPRLTRKPKNTHFIYYDHGCSWRYPQDNKTLNFLAMVDCGIAASHASSRIMELRFHPVFPIHTINNRLAIKNKENTKKNIKQNITLGTASRLVGLKGISIAILIVYELAKKCINTTLLIAGEGNIRKNLEELSHKLGVEDKIKFLGYQSDMVSFYEKIDLYLSTPVTEPFGLSCIESLSHGVPVIFPLIDGQPEAIKDGYCGIGLKPSVSIDEHEKLTGIDISFPHQVYDPINDQLTEPKLLSHLECVSAIERLLNDPPLYESMCKNAIEWSKENMNYEKFKTEFERVLKVLKNNS